MINGKLPRISAALLLAAAFASGETRSPPSCSAGYCQISTTDANIEIIDIDPRAFPREEFYDNWEQRFPPSSPLLNFNAKEDPEGALDAVHDAYAFVARWLPPQALAKLATFPFRKDGPSALVLRG